MHRNVRRRRRAGAARAPGQLCTAPSRDLQGNLKTLRHGTDPGPAAAAAAFQLEVYFPSPASQHVTVPRPAAHCVSVHRSKNVAQ